MSGHVPALAIFCSDIREEKQSTLTLVGVMPDNLNVRKFPGFLGSLGIYVRRAIDPNGTEPPVPLFLIMPDGPPTSIGDIDPEEVRLTREKAKAAGAPVSFLVTKVTFAAFPLPYPGRLLVVARQDGVDHVIAQLNIRLAPGAEQSTPDAPSKLPPPDASPKPTKRPRRKLTKRKTKVTS